MSTTPKAAEGPTHKSTIQDEVLRHLGEGVLEIDARGRVLRANPAALELLWARGVSVLGTNLAAFWGDQTDTVAAALTRLAGPTAPEREVLELSHGQRHLRMTLTRLSRTERAPGFLAVLQDITVLRQRIEELDALNHVASLLNSSQDLQQVLELAIERIAQALHAEAGSLLLRDEVGGDLVFAVAVGPVAHRVRGRRLAPGQGIAGWVARTGKPLLVPDVTADPRFSGGIDKASGFITRSILCTPLRSSDRIIGVVQLLNHTAGRPFGEADLRLLEAISLHTAAVIEQSRLLTTLRRQVDERDALNHVASILNSAHDLPNVLELAIERIAQALHAEAGSLLLRDEVTGDLIFSVAVGPVASWLRGRRLAPGQGIAGWVVNKGEGAFVSDARSDPRFSDAMDKAMGFATRSIVAAPLKTGPKIIGAVELLNRADGRPFTSADLKLLETMAHHAAAVIEGIRLLEREREFSNLLALSNFTEEFSSPLESLGSYLEDLLALASQQNPQLLPTIKKAMERLDTLRHLSRHITRTPPGNT